MIKGSALSQVPYTQRVVTTCQLGGHPDFGDNKINSAKSMHFRVDGIKALGTGGIPRERIQEKDGGVKAWDLGR